MSKANQIDLKDLPLEVRITTDEATNTLTIQDTGVGMNGDEMKLNLGTIARSGPFALVLGGASCLQIKAASFFAGSKLFKEMNAQGDPDIIGQFGA